MNATPSDGSPRLRVLFLCTGNSCRSQMAEAWVRHLRGDRIEAHSAGTAPQRVDPRALLVMAEEGVDLSGQRSKHVAELRDRTFDAVVTLCGDAREQCPVFPGNTRIVHAGLPDPPRLARDAASEQEALAHYRRVRDAIREFISRLPEALTATD